MNPMHNKEYVQKFKDTIRAKQWIDYNTLYNIYIIEGKSVSEIANMYNKKNYQVQYYLDKFDIHKDRNEITKTIKKSNIDKYGVDNIMKCDIGVKSYHNTMTNKYGKRYSKNPMLSSKESIIQGINALSSTIGRKPHILEVCEYFNITHPTLVVILQEYELYDMIDRSNSRLESIVEDYIKWSDVQYVRNTRKIIPPYELDFYIPKYNIAFEINDFASHSFDSDSFYGNKEQYYHQNKSLLCREKGILLIHIYEWEICNRNYIQKLNNYLMQVCGITERLYARKCNIKELEWSEVKQFLDDNHLQNAGVKSSINIGLYYNDALVSVMTFSKSRYTNKYEYELLRLCSKENISVVGGASKMFKYFIRKYSPKSIVSYCSLDNMRGTVYNTLGFQQDEIIPPTYTWCNNKLETYNWKTILDRGVDNVLGTNYGRGTNNIELMHREGFYRVYNAGNIRFIWNNNSDSEKKCNCFIYYSEWK